MGLINYPVEITNYTCQISLDKISLQLFGYPNRKNNQGEEHIADIIYFQAFISKNGSPITQDVFVNRAGFLSISQDITFLYPTLILLESSKIIKLNGDGTLEAKAKVKNHMP